MVFEWPGICHVHVLGLRKWHLEFYSKVLGVSRVWRLEEARQPLVWGENLMVTEGNSGEMLPWVLRYLLAGIVYFSMAAWAYFSQGTPGGSSRTVTTRETSTTPKSSSAKGARSETVDQINNGVIVTPLSDEDSAQVIAGKVEAARKIKDGTGRKPKTAEDGPVRACARALEHLADWIRLSSDIDSRFCFDALLSRRTLAPPEMPTFL